MGAPCTEGWEPRSSLVQPQFPCCQSGLLRLICLEAQEAAWTLSASWPTQLHRPALEYAPLRLPSPPPPLPPGSHSPLTPAKEGRKTPGQGVEPDAQQNKRRPPFGHHSDGQWACDHQVAVQGNGRQGDHRGDAKESPTEGIELTACGHSSGSALPGPSRTGSEGLGQRSWLSLSTLPPCSPGRGWRLSLPYC